MKQGLRRGMTKDELVTNMGEPDFVTHEPGAENWIYLIDDGELHVRLVTTVETLIESGEDDGD